MKASYINPFIKSTCFVLEQFQLGHKIGEPQIRSPLFSSKNVLVVVGITGELRGQIYFGLEERTSLGIVSKMMGGLELAELNEVSQSAVSELGNMICGNAVTIFSSENIALDITPPTIIFGDNLEVNALKTKMLTVPIGIDDMGTIEVNIALKEKNTN